MTIKQIQGAAAAAALAVCIALTVWLQPSVHIAPDDVIVNTRFTSAIVDHIGVAMAVVPAGLSCGYNLDGNAWCQVADWSEAVK